MYDDFMIEAERGERISGGKNAIFEYYEEIGRGHPYEEQHELEADFRDELEEAGVDSDEIDDIIHEWYEICPSREDLCDINGISRNASDAELEEAIDSDACDYFN